MTTILITLAVIVTALFIYLAFLDGNYSVRRSLEIGAGRKAVFDRVRDFRGWPDWSPWLMHDSGTTLVFSEAPDTAGGWYTWDGKLVGAGKLIHEDFTGEEKIEQRLEFTRPFKSVCRVWWEFETRGDDRTLVHWNMTGKMPFLFRFMAKKMPQVIGKDYATGLYMLRSEFEPGAEVPRISFDGITSLPERSAFVIPFEGSHNELKKAMADAFPRLGSYIEKHNVPTTGHPFTINHKFDPQRMTFDAEFAWPVSTDTTPAGFELKTFEGGRFYKTTLQGSYEFLELAWHQSYAHLQMEKIKVDRKRASLEVYENDPLGVSHSNEITTSIYIPVRGG